ncbi:MAG: helix-turn-helix transcriptional regulator [Planctomycetia bacterium]|nr:helix-turn-helix transcriptional regulator [Planctomycetia bacterium]
MATTEFGKILRKIRIDHDEILLNMAKKLEVTSSYLSAIENGKRNIPDDWVSRLSVLYSLPDAVQQELLRAAIEQSQSLRINLANSSVEDKDIVFAFARQIGQMDEETKEKLRNVLNQKKKDTE